MNQERRIIYLPLKYNVEFVVKTISIKIEVEEAHGFARIIVWKWRVWSKANIWRSLNEVLEIKEFDEEVFKETIEKIKVEENRTITVILKNRNVIKKGMV